MTPVYVGLGGNLPGTLESFKKARTVLDDRFNLTQSSSVLETEPLNVQTEKTFRNQVVELSDVSLRPHEFLQFLLKLERRLGRDRSTPPDRIIDLDILYFDQLVLRQRSLRLPHPRLHRRLFVLEPMVELHPDFIHPVLKKTQSELLVNVREKNNENQT